MSVKAAKAKRTKLTTAQELRSLRAWQQRTAKDLVHAKELIAEQAATLKGVLDVQKLLLRNLERLVREKETLVTVAQAAGVKLPERLPDDFVVQPIHRIASR